MMLQAAGISLIHRRNAAMILMILLVVLSGRSVFSQETGPGTAVVVEIKGAIGPAVADYFQRALDKAEESGAAIIILQMDTPGGSRAASAGTYILYASHVAAMAPTTNLGAATPIKIGGIPGLPEEKPDFSGEQEKEVEVGVPRDTHERKIVNDAAAFIMALAARHGRNAEWAEKAVREAVSLTAEEALGMGVIDLVAPNLENLLQQLDGRVVVMEEGNRVTLSSSDLNIVRMPPGWRTRILAVVTDPNVAYMLMLLGIYGLIYELANPGFVLPGVVGAICLLLALYTFQILPINYAGLALIVLGIGFMVAEAFAPSFGALGVGGVVSFVVGSIILLDAESMRISLNLIGSTALVSTGFILWLISRVLTMSRRKVRTGTEELVGSIGEAMDDFTGEGRIRVHGESWRALSPTSVQKGRKVRVISREGLLLKVNRVEEDRT